MYVCAIVGVSTPLNGSLPTLQILFKSFFKKKSGFVLNQIVSMSYSLSSSKIVNLNRLDNCCIFGYIKHIMIDAVIVRVREVQQ